MLNQRFLTIGSVVKNVPMRIFPQEIHYLERKHNGRIVATTHTYADVNAIQMATGRFLTEEDSHAKRNVAVIGSAVAEKLFPLDDAVGQSVRLGAGFYSVVGVVSSRKPLAAVGVSSAENLNDDIYIPLKTCQVNFGERILIRQEGQRTAEQVELHQIIIIVDDPARTQSVAEAIRKMLKENHEKQDWEVTVR